MLYLTIAVLVVATATLWFTYPRPAKLDVDRLSEMDEYTYDLMFEVRPNPNPENVPIDPRSYLLQLRVAVANVGRRKAVLSTIAIDKFITKSGKEMFLPESVQGPIWGSQWRQQFGYVGGQTVFQNVSSPGPWVLGADDVVVISFRSRRGITWRPDQWDLEKLEAYYNELNDPLVSARLKIAWRRASWYRSKMEVRHSAVVVDLRVLQQAEYVAAIKDRTADFTEMPEIEPMTIDLE